MHEAAKDAAHRRHPRHIFRLGRAANIETKARPKRDRGKSRVSRRGWSARSRDLLSRHSFRRLLTWPSLHFERGAVPRNVVFDEEVLEALCKSHCQTASLGIVKKAVDRESPKARPK